MTNLTAWAAGSLPGTTSGAFTPAFNLSDMASLPTLSSVLSTITFDNTVATVGTPDQFMDISFTGALSAPETIPNGAAIGFWLYILQADGTTYGGGRLAAGTQAVFSPSLNPLGGIPIEAGTSITNIAGSVLSLTIPPRKFALVMQNQTTWPFAATGLLCKISTYRQNTNA